MGRPHGVRGAVLLHCDASLTGEVRRGLVLGLERGDSRRSVTVRDCGRSGDSLRVRLEGIEDRDAAAELTGAAVWAQRGDLSPLGADEFFDRDLIGLDVMATDGRRLGTITEVLPTGANDVYVVAGDDGEILVPAVDGAVEGVDLPGRRMIVFAEALEYQRETPARKACRADAEDHRGERRSR